MADLSTRGRGRVLNRVWGIGAKHALYRKNGTWYHLLTGFPGALIDAHGYILFATEQEYLQCPSLQIGKEIGVPGGIAQIDGYIRVEPLDDITTSQEESASQKPLIKSLQIIQQLI